MAVWQRCIRNTFLDFDVGPLEFVIVKMEKPKMKKLWHALVPGNSDW